MASEDTATSITFVRESNGTLAQRGSGRVVWAAPRGARETAPRASRFSDGTSDYLLVCLDAAVGALLRAHRIDDA